MATPDFRRRKGDDKHPWHFCSNCKYWPTEDYESSTRPQRPVCRDCESLARRQMCTRTEAFL